MKSIIIYFQITVVTILVLFTSSCENFLTNPPVDRLTSDGFYRTPAQSEQGIIGIYAGLRSLSSSEFFYLSELRSDNLWTLPQPDGFREYSELSTFRAGEDLPTLNRVWNAWYKVIYDANMAIVKIPECDFGTRETFRNQLLGEAHFLRGWAYFELTRLFGNIPIISHPASPNEVLNIPQSTAREVYDNIVLPDLKRAKEYLPPDADLVNANNASIAGRGRADRIAVTAMLGRVYMTMAGFPLNDAGAKALARTELEAVINFSKANGNKYWAPDAMEWKKQWMSDNNNKYSIFAIQYRSGGTGNPMITETGTYLPPSYSTQSRPVNFSGIYVEKSIVAEFLKNEGQDIRGINHSILLEFEAEPNFPAHIPQLEDINLSNPTGIEVPVNSLFYKYYNSKIKRVELGYDPNIEAEMTGNTDWPINYPIIRYEDVLLMFAELLAETNPTSALQIVNDIRTRAGCDAVTTADGNVLDLVKYERRIELFGEGVRWFDLVRWNEWEQAVKDQFARYNNPAGTYTDNVRAGRHLYPIPLAQTNVKPGWYKQNSGY